MGTAPPCGYWVTSLSGVRLAPEQKGGSLEGCTSGTEDSEFPGKGLSETTAWGPGHVPAWQQAQLPGLGALLIRAGCWGKCAVTGETVSGSRK